MDRERPLGPGLYGVDASPSVRPGVPRERHLVNPAGAGTRPPQQEDLSPLSRAGLLHVTPVFGTAAPPRGLSGAVRRLAYGIPEHHASRWVLLLGADRLDVLEHRLASAAWLLPAAAALGVGFALTARALRRSS